MLLTIDIGNSRINCGLFNGRKLIKHKGISIRNIKDIRGSVFNNSIKTWDYSEAVICSVVPRFTSVIKKQLKVPVLVINNKSDIGLKIKYKRPREVGADRLANAAAVKFLYGHPAFVIDFGTAVTIDIISCTGDYLGGVILPGLDMIRYGLYEKTALLPLVSIKKTKKILGQSTKTAIQSGIYHGMRGTVKQLIKDLKKELRFPQKTVIITTGGYAGILGSGIGKMDEFITLKGLEVIYERYKRH